MSVAAHADIADTSEKRRRGVLARNEFPAGDGLWIVPCEGVHTFGMKFPIDVLFLNKKRKVLKIRTEMKKSRISFCLTAHSVLELPAGMAAQTGTVVGDELAIEKRQVAE